MTSPPSGIADISYLRREERSSIPEEGEVIYT
jgi:hypothetical protein